MSAFSELMGLRSLSPPDDDELEIIGSDPVQIRFLRLSFVLLKPRRRRLRVLVLQSMTYGN